MSDILIFDQAELGWVELQKDLIKEQKTVRNLNYGLAPKLFKKLNETLKEVKNPSNEFKKEFLSKLKELSLVYDLSVQHDLFEMGVTAAQRNYATKGEISHVMADYSIRNFNEGSLGDANDNITLLSELFKKEKPDENMRLIGENKNNVHDSELAEKSIHYLALIYGGHRWSDREDYVINMEHFKSLYHRTPAERALIADKIVLMTEEEITSQSKEQKAHNNQLHSDKIMRALAIGTSNNKKVAHDVLKRISTTISSSDYEINQQYEFIDYVERNGLVKKDDIEQTLNSKIAFLQSKKNKKSDKSHKVEMNRAIDMNICQMMARNPDYIIKYKDILVDAVVNDSDHGGDMSDKLTETDYISHSKQASLSNDVLLKHHQNCAVIFMEAARQDPSSYKACKHVWNAVLLDKGTAETALSFLEEKMKVEDDTRRHASQTIADLIRINPTNKTVVRKGRAILKSYTENNPAAKEVQERETAEYLKTKYGIC